MSTVDASGTNCGLRRWGTVLGRSEEGDILRSVLKLKAARMRMEARHRRSVRHVSTHRAVRNERVQTQKADCAVGNNSKRIPASL